MPRTPRRFRAAVAVGLALMLVAPAAFARTVYLNGVEVADLRRQTIKDATVYIDENGDVHIDAPRYKVEVVDERKGEPAGEAKPSDEGSTAGANASLRQRYFLVTKPSEGGAAQYDVTLKVNGVTRKTIKAADPEVIVEISAWFKPGPNTVELVARKNMAGGRKSFSAGDVERIVIGAGHEDGAIVKVDVVQVDFKCDASQLDDITKTYVFNAL